MDIILDFRTLHGSSKNRGIGEYGRNIAIALANDGHQIKLLTWEMDFEDDLNHPNIGTLYPHKSFDADVIHVIDPMTIKTGIDNPFCSVNGINARIKTSTWFDAIPVTENYIKAWPLDIQRAYYTRIRSIEGCDHVFAISEDSAEQWKQVSKSENISVAPIGIEHFDYTENTATIEQIRMVEAMASRPFLLTVGGCEPHKNIPLVREVYMALKAFLPDVIWCVIGKESEYQNRLKLNVLPGQYFLGHLPRKELEFLYKNENLLALMFPSLVEGFGLPAFEAAIKGANVLCLDECKAMGALPIPKMQCLPGAFIEALNRISNGDTRYRLDDARITDLKNKFSWANCAKLMGETWQNLLK